MPRSARLFVLWFLLSAPALAQSPVSPPGSSQPQEVAPPPVATDRQAVPVPAATAQPQAEPQPVTDSPQATVPPAQTATPPSDDAQPAAGSVHPQAVDAKSAGKGTAEKKDNDAPIRADQIHHPVLWHDPGQIATLDLFNGSGGREEMPKAPFTFESEDKNGTNPKFDVHDANGKKWRVKLGPEVRPEVVASRLLWAVGFYVNDDYVLESVDVDNLHLSRGSNLARNGHLEIARFARKPDGQKKIGIWEWKQNPFTGSREFNGLRVMMAVMNNWDLKDVNNAVYHDKQNDRDIFLTSDVGATFGTNGIVLPIAHSKGDIDSYKKSKFITRTTATEVDFSTPKKPTGMLLETLGTTAKEYAMRSGLDWIGNNIPRQDARWMGSLLSQLSHQQLVDAFRAGGFPQDQIGVYVEIIENRIQELKTL